MTLYWCGCRSRYYPFRTAFGVQSFLFFFSSRRRHTRFDCDWSSDVCSSDLKMLFQGLSAGVRLDMPAHISVYTSLGRNKRETDVTPSWNYMYGLMLGRLGPTGIRADFRYSKFESSFGKGHYMTGILFRDFSDKLRMSF